MTSKLGELVYLLLHAAVTVFTLICIAGAAGNKHWDEGCFWLLALIAIQIQKATDK
jgi:hypothetical protein